MHGADTTKMTIRFLPVKMDVTAGPAQQFLRAVTR